MTEITVTAFEAWALGALAFGALVALLLGYNPQQGVGRQRAPRAVRAAAARA